ncbi:hypothetical protein [Streptomyces chartreusis]
MQALLGVRFLASEYGTGPEPQSPQRTLAEQDDEREATGTFAP